MNHTKASNRLIEFESSLISIPISNSFKSVNAQNDEKIKNSITKNHSLIVFNSHPITANNRLIFTQKNILTNKLNKYF